MDTTAHMLATSHELYARNATANPNPATRPPAYKAVGIALAIASGVFIGVSFVMKKVGLLRANVKYQEEAGEGYGYLKNAYWWTGMILMIVGEICNFVAYAFVDAILVTPLGALSVVITTILSAIFLKERLSFVGKIGCFICIVGSVVIVMNAPAQSSAATIQEMKHYVIAPGFLSFAGVVILACLFIALWAGPRYGKKSMLVYLSICSLIGGLSVVATQGLGAAVVTQAGGTPQFNQWFLYVLLVFVIATLVTEIIYLNKALNIFNAALVTPTYYVFFTSSTIVSSSILFRGFKGSPTSIITVVMGFLQICAGVVLLQLSKSAKDVPDTAVFTGDLDQVRTVAEQEQPESEPKADAIRGTAGIIRQLSNARLKWEAAEAKKVYEDKMKDQMEPIGENEQVEWDGLRRRKTTLGNSAGALHRRKTLHPPLGLSHFPDADDYDSQTRQSGTSGGFQGSFLSSFRSRRDRSTRVSSQPRNFEADILGTHAGGDAESLTKIPVPPYVGLDSDVPTKYSHHPDGAMEMSHVFGLPQGLQQANIGDSGHSSHASHIQPSKPIVWADTVEDRPRSQAGLAPDSTAHGTRRQFSFQNVFNRHKHGHSADSSHSRSSCKGIGSRQSSKEASIPGIKSATEEERLGLVKGDSTHMSPLPDYRDEDDEDRNPQDDKKSSSAADLPDYEAPTQQWSHIGEEAPQLRNIIPETSKLRMNDNDSDSEQDLGNIKDWEYGAGKGGSGGGRDHAFI
ncbi:MAG: hypothetical protein Q9187_005096 [Circinaria calcarea]